MAENDNLYNIASKYKTTVNEIKKLNNLSSDLLQIGQKLQIPVISSISKYTVQKGDTLYGISRKFNTTVSDLLALNNLSSSVLQIGQELIVKST